MEKINYFWFRRDLRLNDQIGLHQALNSGFPVQCLFIFDREILDKLEDKDDARVSFIHKQLKIIDSHLRDWGSGLRVEYGTPEKIWKEIFDHEDINAIYYNRDFEPYARSRDEAISNLAKNHQVDVQHFLDHLLLDPEAALKDDGDPYVVFTPFSRKWKSAFWSGRPNDIPATEKEIERNEHLKSYKIEPYKNQFAKSNGFDFPSLEDMGFEKSDIEIPDNDIDQEIIAHYGERRNFPAQNGTSRLGVHLRFGTLSIRKLARAACALDATYLNELIWREFYAMILHHFPHVVDGPFRKKYEAIEWRNNEEEFEKWCQGKTGYPIVDAGMRELNSTGYMHNRVRMIVASFLTKHLLINWQWGEAYFARKLLDFELASNSGGWQWAAGCGTDAAPYFRIFNPESQQKKFDKEFRYIKKWVPEFGGPAYPAPIVDHKMARQRCLDTYKSALDGK